MLIYVPFEGGVCGLVVQPQIFTDMRHNACSSRAPDTARIKAKMMYASTKDFFKGHLDGLSIELQANEHEDITEESIGEAVKSVITRQ